MANEKRLIDANALERQFIDYVRTPPHFHYGDWQNMCINGTEIDEVIANAPTVDAVEVVHADWKDCENADFVYCTNCKKEWNVFDNRAELFYYCPNCGAKMDGGNEDGKLLFADMEEIIDATD